MNEVKLPVTGLTSLELACLTARVPASGNPLVDNLILQGLRFQTASEYMVRAVLEYKDGHQDAFERRAQTAKLIADTLIKAFQNGKT